MAIPSDFNPVGNAQQQMQEMMQMQNQLDEAGNIRESSKLIQSSREDDRSNEAAVVSQSTQALQSLSQQFNQ